LGADPVAYAIARASHDSPPILNAFTVRKEQKEHGLARTIEGCFEAETKVVVVEDVITSGASALRAIQAVQAAGGTPIGVLGVVDREEGGLDAITAAGIPVRAMVSIRQLGIAPG
jgi:orotate phosphoribosyltransferase